MITKSIRDVLNNRARRAVAPDTNLSVAMDIMEQSDLETLVVLKDGVVLGMLREADVLRHVSQHGGMNSTPVSDVMTRDVRYIETRDSISEALSRMSTGGHSHLPVLDTGRVFIGVLAQEDIPDEYHMLHRRYSRWKRGAEAA